MNFPQLSRLRSLVKQYPPYDFSNTILVAIQHLMGTNGSLFELLNRLGLPYEQMYLLGKVYSTNEGVYRELRYRGTFVHPASMSLNRVRLDRDYNLSLAKSADELLGSAIAKLEGLPSSAKTLLVVDDGGVLISLVNGRVAGINARILGVEQTRSGAEALRAINGLRFPIVNVAESNIKLQDESPYIASSIIEHIIERLTRLPGSKLVQGSNILVVGHGAIGSNVAEQLRLRAKAVDIHDQNSGIDVIKDFKQAIRNKDLVVGCVGKAWLPKGGEQLLKQGIVFASGSSSNSEFLGLSVDPRRKLASALTFPNQGLTKAHSDYVIAGGKGWVLNAGFPVNFDGSIDPIAPHTIELTRMLMLGGILQALTMPMGSGLQKFDSRPATLTL